MLLSPRWEAAPFRCFVLKIHSRCNLRCDYCYIYEMADEAWRSRSHVMTSATIEATAFRIAEHAEAHGIADLEIVLHGGEPLLAGLGPLAHAVAVIRAVLGKGKRAHIGVQTNGIRLNEEFLELFERLDVKVGLSIDGDREMHDRHRRTVDGSGSYPAVAAAAARLMSHPRIFSGFLSVIDPRHDPVRAYEELLRFSPPTIDFLLPHGNWSVPPPGRLTGALATPYGDWLIAVFDRWYGATQKETSVRLFEEIIALLLGGSSRIEGIGLSPVTVAVVESDGDIERSDMLKSAYPAAGATGCNVHRDSFDAVLHAPGMAPLQLGLLALCEKCRQCPIVRICGGGLYAHRYHSTSGFANPSVYCPDLYRLISHIHRRLVSDLEPLNRSCG
jgi:uncharacterized protein